MWVLLLTIDKFCWPCGEPRRSSFRQHQGGSGGGDVGLVMESVILYLPPSRLLLHLSRYKGCRKSTCFDNSPRYVKFDHNLAPLLEVRKTQRQQSTTAEVTAVAQVAVKHLRAAAFGPPKRDSRNTKKHRTLSLLLPVVGRGNKPV